MYTKEITKIINKESVYKHNRNFFEEILTTLIFGVSILVQHFPAIYF